MSGILDTKSRVIDTLLTLSGRKQIALGKLKAEYFTFSDAATYYLGDTVDGTDDASKRIYFESCHLPQDEITFEADDSGRLISGRDQTTISNYTLQSGKLISYNEIPLTASVYEGSNENLEVLSGSTFASAAESLINTSLNNFQNLMVIGTKDRVFEDDEFKLSHNNITFYITDEKGPIINQNERAGTLENMDSLFYDPKLQHVKNFKYLPPINKKGAGDQKIDLGIPGEYSPINSATTYDILKGLKDIESMGFSYSVKIDPTSYENNLIFQMFEVQNDTIMKLDMLDYGTIYDNQRIEKRVFLFGKIYKDSNETNIFVHMFTLCFER